MINDEIDRLRLATTSALLSGRRDVIVVVGAEVGVVVGVDGDYRLYLVAPEHYPYYYVLVCEPNVYRVALHSEVSALEMPCSISCRTTTITSRRHTYRR